MQLNLERNGLTMKINDLIAEKKQDVEWANGYENIRDKFETAIVLYNARTEAGLTQSELAELAGTSQKTVANIEKGDNVTIDKFTEIANALGKRVKITLA